ncbi:uncharacterized protein LOC120482209 [Pimephales promelas]|uniref:uncharacterized protein LOC120482209 n=1 Tax=Pimephales promelas TaxID=90988 RepID=UPI0019557C62|nr:uncharacterized protein LOC120482209 [Pimephales promelas]
MGLQLQVQSIKMRLTPRDTLAHHAHERHPYERHSDSYGQSAPNPVDKPSFLTPQQYADYAQPETHQPYHPVRPPSLPYPHVEPTYRGPIPTIPHFCSEDPRQFARLNFTGEFATCRGYRTFQSKPASVSAVKKEKPTKYCPFCNTVQHYFNQCANFKLLDQVESWLKSNQKCFRCGCDHQIPQFAAEEIQISTRSAHSLNTAGSTTLTHWLRLSTFNHSYGASTSRNSWRSCCCEPDSGGLCRAPQKSSLTTTVSINLHFVSRSRTVQQCTEIVAKWTHFRIGVRHRRQDTEAVQILEEKTIRVAVGDIQRYATPLLWKINLPPLQSAKEAVTAHLRSTEKRLLQNTDLASVYVKEVHKLEKGGSISKLTPEETDKSRWNQDPQFLTQSVSWPKQPHDVVSDDIQEHRSCTFCGALSSQTDIPDISQYNSLQDLIKATAVSLHGASDESELSADDYTQAEQELLRCAEVESFPEEIAPLQLGKPVSHSSRLPTLAPEYDHKAKLVRVGGRLRRCKHLDSDTLHHIVLDPAHPLVKLLIQHHDNLLLHPGPERVFAELR